MRRRTLLSSLLPVPRRPFLFRVRGASGLYIAPDSKLGRMNTDGSGFEVIDFARPNEPGSACKASFAMAAAPFWLATKRIRLGIPIRSNNTNRAARTAGSGTCARAG
jgi:hypothetical protein